MGRFFFSLSMRSLLPGLAGVLLASVPASAQNPVQIENMLPGVSDWVIPAGQRVSFTNWETTDHSLAEIEGYASLTSVAAGETIRFYVNTAEPEYQMRFYRIGWYDGRGAREMLKVDRDGVAQPACPVDATTRMVHCNWTDPFELSIPGNWLSGIYLVKLTPSISRRENYMIFVVRDDRTSDFLFLSAVNTFQAYNWWGGGDAYGAYSPVYPGGDSSENASRKVSFDRPYGYWNAPRMGTGDFFAWEINMVRWLEREGYDVAYGTNIDLHTTTPLALTKRRTLLSVGHDEYWSWEMRENAENARDQCVSLGFFSANSVYWQVRLEPAPLTGQPDRVLVAYKSRALSEDPLALDGNLANDYLITNLWRAPRPGFLRPKPEDALLGVMYAFWSTHSPLIVTDPSHPAFAGTTTRTFPGLVGYEADRMYGNAPAGTMRLAHSPIAPTTHYDCDSAADSCAADMTLYRAPSGARVFAAGTIQWPWGLDPFALEDDAAPASVRIGVTHPEVQQITRNLLEELKRPEPCTPSPLPLTTSIADIAVSISDLEKSGRLSLVECLSAGTCFEATRDIRRGYSTIVLYPGDPMQPVQPVPLPAPPPASHDITGSHWILQASEATKGPIWLTLHYDDTGLSATEEASLDVLHLEQGPNGPSWRVVPSTKDAKLDAIHAQLPQLTSVVLGIPVPEPGLGSSLAAGLGLLAAFGGPRSKKRSCSRGDRCVVVSRIS